MVAAENGAKKKILEESMKYVRSLMVLPPPPPPKGASFILRTAPSPPLRKNLSVSQTEACHVVVPRGPGKDVRGMAERCTRGSQHLVMAFPALHRLIPTGVLEAEEYL